MRARIILFLFLGMDALMLFFESNTLSISHHEAELVYNSTSLLHQIITTSLTLFGNNDFALRLPMILMHLISVLLLYAISGRYLRYDTDRLWLVLIYMLLPGINSAALLVDHSGLVIMLLLLYIYSQNYSKVVQYGWLISFLFIDVSFAFLYLGHFFYAIKKKKNQLLILNLLLFGLSLYIHGFDTHGSPSGHFLDTLGVYAAIFSPIIFIYLFYILYRRFVTKTDDFLWCLAATALIFSLLLSLRQQIEVEVFAPYLILAMPLAAQAFFRSYRVRLKMFRGKYRTVFTISLILLVINVLVVMFNKELYRFIEKPSKHFAYDHHVAKDLASQLKDAGVACVHTEDDEMQLRLQFYGIEACQNNILSSQSDQNMTPVTIRYNGVTVYEKYVSKVPR